MPRPAVTFDTDGTRALELGPLDAYAVPVAPPVGLHRLMTGPARVADCVLATNLPTPAPTGTGTNPERHH